MYMYQRAKYKQFMHFSQIFQLTVIVGSMVVAMAFSERWKVQVQSQLKDEYPEQLVVCVLII